MSQQRKTDHMYPWIDRKRNFIGGRCLHECVYCYVERFKKRWAPVRARYSGEPRLLEQELKKSEGSRHTVFVQDCGDLFAKGIPAEWIVKVLDHLNHYPDNQYLLQNKNPERFSEFIGFFPPITILGTTLESNKNYPVSKAPEIQSRVQGIQTMRANSYQVMVSVEPIFDFDLDEFLQQLKQIKQLFISIGADSKGHDLPEPPAEKIEILIYELEKYTEVKRKSNLQRLMGN